MKKLTSFLFALSFTGTTSLMAQSADDTNLLSNPGFEDTDFQVFKYEEVTNCINYVAGWDATHKPGDADFAANDYNNPGLNKYMVRGQVGYYPADSDTAKAGNKQYIRISRYEWTKPNEWFGDGGLQQTVDVKPSSKYELTFLYRLSSHAEKGTIVPAWVSFEEVGKTATKKKLYNNLDEKWTEKSYTFTTSADATKAIVKLGVTGGYIYDWGGNIRLWADFDEVRLVDVTTGTSIKQLLSDDAQIRYTIQGSALCLEGLEAGCELAVYNVTGSLVTSFRTASSSETVYLPGKGIYIIKNGDRKKALKVVIP
ncbi:hypothetical protein [Bacteroides sp.]